MEIKRRPSRIFDLEDSNPIDFVKNLSVFKNYTAEDRKFWRLRDLLDTEDEKKTKSSSQFVLQNVTWRFFSYVIYSGLDTFRDGNTLSIRLHPISNDVALDKLNVRIGIVKKSGKELALSSAQASTGFFSTYVPLYNLNPWNLILESWEDWSTELFLFIEINEKDGEKRPKIPISLLHDFTSLFLSGRYSDFTIKVKETEFKVHRSILAGRSPVFFEMTRCDWPRRKQNCKKEVSINDAEPTVFKEFLLYLYSGSEEHLNWRNISEFYKLANTYRVQDLTELCTEYLKKKLRNVNFFDIYLISLELYDLELLEAVLRFFKRNQQEIVSSDKYGDFLRDHRDKAWILFIPFKCSNQRLVDLIDLNTLSTASTMHQ